MGMARDKKPKRNRKRLRSGPVRVVVKVSQTWC
jgi:hypothetical protein